MNITPAVPLDEILVMNLGLQVHLKGEKRNVWSPKMRHQFEADAVAKAPMVTMQLRAGMNEATESGAI
jgi:hypothetical protein